MHGNRSTGSLEITVPTLSRARFAYPRPQDSIVDHIGRPSTSFVSLVRSALQSAAVFDWSRCLSASCGTGTDYCGLWGVSRPCVPLPRKYLVERNLPSEPSLLQCLTFQRPARQSAWPQPQQPVIASECSCPLPQPSVSEAVESHRKHPR